jgi:outer membrane protein W
MKKLIFLVIFLMALGLTGAEAGKFSLSIGAGIRNVKGVEDENGINLYTEVYGKNNMTYSIDLGYQVSKPLHVFLHSGYFSVKGTLTYTGEDTELTIIPIEVGLRFFKGYKNLFPYFGVGTGYYLYREENVIGTVDEKKIGFFAEGGLRFQFTRRFFTDLKVKYIFLEVTGAEGQVDLGGFALMGGIGISF